LYEKLIIRDKMNRNKLIAVAVAVIVIVGAGYYIGSNRGTENQQVAEVQDQKSVSYAGQDGKSVCDILKENHEVDSTESSFGEMVNSIDGLASTDSEFWLYQVNGTSGEISCDQQMTTSSDQILWEYKGV
jgi:hypothetical protein